MELPPPLGGGRSVASALAWLKERSLNLKQYLGLRLTPPQHFSLIGLYAPR